MPDGCSAAVSDGWPIQSRQLAACVGADQCNLQAHVNPATLHAFRSCVLGVLGYCILDAWAKRHGAQPRWIFLCWRVRCGQPMAGHLSSSGLFSFVQAFRADEG